LDSGTKTGKKALGCFKDSAIDKRLESDGETDYLAYNNHVRLILD
jgi:hypothetical protein